MIDPLRKRFSSMRGQSITSSGLLYTFFYHDDTPDEEFLRRLVLTSPSEQEIPFFKAFLFDDMDKIVPDRTFEKFITSTVQTFQTKIEEEAERHTISGHIRLALQQDENFTFETVKALPNGIHPKYTGEEAELRQKPASRVDHMDGAQGFLRIWIPVDEEEIALVSATAGEYDREAIVDAIREEFEAVAETY